MSATRIENSGVPSCPNRATLPAPYQAIVDGIIIPETPISSFGQLVADLMDGLPDEAVLVVCPTKRKVFAGSGASATNMIGVLESDFNLATTTGKIVLTPDVGQSGVSLTWNAVKQASSSVEHGAAVDSLVLPAKPRRSVSSLVSGLLGVAWEGVPPVILVNQLAGEVRLLVPDPLDAQDHSEMKISDAMLGVVSGVIALDLTGSAESVDPTSPKLIFEGGAIT